MFRRALGGVQGLRSVMGSERKINRVSSGSCHRLSHRSGCTWFVPGAACLSAPGRGHRPALGPRPASCQGRRLSSLNHQNWEKLKLRLPQPRIMVVFSENSQNNGSLPLAMGRIFHTVSVDVIPGTANGMNNRTDGQPQGTGREAEETGVAGV